MQRHFAHCFFLATTKQVKHLGLNMVINIFLDFIFLAKVIVQNTAWTRNTTHEERQ